MQKGMQSCIYKREVKWVYHIFISLLTALSLTLEFKIPEYTGLDFTVSREFIVNIEKSLIVDPFKSTLLFGMIFIWSIKIELMNSNKINIIRYKLYYFICMVLGFVWLSAKSYLINNSLVNIYATTGQVVKSSIYYVGTVYFLILVGKTVFLLADSASLITNYQVYTNIKNLRCKTFLFFFIIWLPHIIMAYPASLISDVWGQLAMFYGRKTFTTHHPPFHTWLIGMAVKFGGKIGNVNIGLFLFILFQFVIFTLIISYEIDSMRRFNAPRWLIILTMIIAGISPYYTAYIGLITKDTLYSYFFLLFMIELYYLLTVREKYFENIRHICLFLLSSVAVVLFRNNGKYVIYPMLLIIIFLIITRKIRLQSRRSVIGLLSSSTLIILIPLLINFALTKVYDIEKGSVKEMLSLPFQQTARYIVNHGDEISEEEKQVIDRILDYNSLAQNYNPILSDAVKTTFKQESTQREMFEYFCIWMHQFCRDPFTYISATMNQNYRLVYPYKIKYIYLETYKDKTEFMKEVGVEEIEQIEKSENNLRSFYNIMFDMPLVGAFSIIALYNLVLIYGVVYAIYRKLYVVLLFSVPLIISNLIVVAAPLVHPRYILSVVYSIPLLILCIANAIRQVLQRYDNSKITIEN